MLCPHCTNTTLAMTERQGIEIDYCPTCRGIWLDRGELDRLIERAERGEGGERGYMGERGQYGDRGHGQPHAHGQRKKKSLLGDLFDF